MAIISPTYSGAIDKALSDLINASSTSAASSADEPRNAFVFGSKMRNLLKITANAPDSTVDNSIQDTTNQMVKAQPLVIMQINPRQIEFDQPKRYVRQDTQAGSVFHHFTDSKGQNNDILTIRMRGTTGNINRLSHRTQEAQKAARDRLETWHNLYQLTREPMLLLPAGIANEFYIDYVSALFPVTIRFTGFYTKVLKFAETADKPNSREYEFEFIVQKTSPDINDLVARILDIVNQQASVVDPGAQILSG